MNNAIHYNSKVVFWKFNLMSYTDQKMDGGNGQRMLSHRGNFRDTECFLCTSGSLCYHGKSMGPGVNRLGSNPSTKVFWLWNSGQLLSLSNLQFPHLKNGDLANEPSSRCFGDYLVQHIPPDRCSGGDYSKRFFNSQVFRLWNYSLVLEHIHIVYVNLQTWLSRMFGCQCTGFLIQIN